LQDFSSDCHWLLLPPAVLPQPDRYPAFGLTAQLQYLHGHQDLFLILF